MKKLLAAAVMSACALTVSADYSDQVGYYYPEQEPDDIWQEWEFYATADLEWSGINAGFWDYDMVVNKRVSKDPDVKKYQLAFEKWFGYGGPLIVEYDPDTKKFRVPVQMRGIENIWDNEPMLTCGYTEYFGTEDPYSSWNEETGKLELYIITYYPNQDLGDGTFGNREYSSGVDKYTFHGFANYGIDIQAPECVSSFDITTNLKMSSLPKDANYEVINDLVTIYDDAVFERVAKDRRNPIDATTEVSLTLKEGVNSIVGTSYNDKGELVKSLKNIYCMPEDADNWTKLGTGKFTEDAVLGLGGAWTPTTMDVEIEEHKTRAGFYRLKDPYRSLPAYWPDLTYTQGEITHYMYIDATNPNIVMLAPDATGIYVDDKLRNAYLTSKAYEMKREGKLQPEYVPFAGKLADGTITFPQAAVGIRLPEYTKTVGEDLIYWVNNNSRFIITLPTAGISNVEADNGAATEYFTLQGIKLAQPENGQVVIVRRGAEVAKEIYRR